ncbi:uncharacterized protein RHO25_013096 [Cercospora beticola]|uniref:Uncharacterized protein n=1 Tax=Cercospora beticola TaxID=122368 RepID=A0ABZ0PA61_CERBT|nr:hypothetical protein RHO25_013096 [Cercospora beticola]CAK1367668.1 unnamed protein product [Cercospora beticola]
MTKPDIRSGPRFMKPDREIEKTNQPIPKGTHARMVDKCGVGKIYRAKIKAAEERKKAAKKREKAKQERQKREGSEGPVKRAPSKVTKPKVKKQPYKEQTSPKRATSGRVLRSDKDSKSLLPGLP